MLRERLVRYIYVVNDAGWFSGVVHARDATSTLADGRDTSALRAADRKHQIWGRRLAQLLFMEYAYTD